MSIQYEIQVHTDHVCMVCEGDYVLTDALHIIQTALETADRNKLLKILFDWRNVQGQLTTMQRYELAEQGASLYAKMPAAGRILIAMVNNEETVDPERFGEEVAINRGVPLKVTTDMQEALMWLGIDTDGRA